MMGAYASVTAGSPELAYVDRKTVAYSSVYGCLFRHMYNWVAGICCTCPGPHRFYCIYVWKETLGECMNPYLKVVANEISWS